jgi:Vitamin K-dependent gamma-carboxylase
MDRNTEAAFRRAAAGLNPLRMSGTALPPNLLMAAKLLVLAYVLGGWLTELPDGFLPFVSYLGYFNGSVYYRHALQAIIVGAALALWLNRAVRASCLIIGLVLLLAILSSQPYYHNNLLYTGLFFVIAGLYDERLGSLLFRAQLAVIYLGAGLNKLLQADWRTGAFVQDWLRPEHYESGYIYAHFASLLPGTMLSALLSWIAILTEFALIPLLLVPRFVPLAIFVGVSYHTGLVLITGGSTFGMFWYALVATYIALLRWPVRMAVNYNTQDKLQLELDRGTRIDRFTGVAAITRILLYTPAFYIACVLLFTMPNDIVLVTYALIFGIGISYCYVPQIKAMKARLWRRASGQVRA